MASRPSATPNRWQPEPGHRNAPEPAPRSSTPSAYLAQLAGTKRKRSAAFEAEADEPEGAHPSKRLRRLSQLKPSERTIAKADTRHGVSDARELQEFSPLSLPVPPSPASKHARGSLPISEDDLDSLYEEVMDFRAHAARVGSLKRSSSRRSIAVASETESFQSQRSTNTTAHYRYKHLKDANVYIHVDPPEDIQAAIDGIINVKLPEDRHAIPVNLAKTFWTECKEMVQAAAGEDDFVHSFYTIADKMSPDHLISRENADWRWELKPKIKKLEVNWSFLSDVNATVADEQQDEDNVSAPPPSSKRRQQSAGRQYMSPQDSQPQSFDGDEAAAPSDHRPSQPERIKETSSIKTPRPDVTTGIKQSALISALVAYLSSQHLHFTKAKAHRFLEMFEEIPSTRDGPQEPVLIIVPTQRESALTFPTLGFEGKGYSTGKQVFEAQNQAAVLGACGLKIQLMLDELVQRAIGNPEGPLTPSTHSPSLVFAICTEGPHHELWANYTVVEDGERQFNMVLLNTCYGVILEQVERFFVQIYNIMVWTAGPFLETTAERLGKVIMKAAAGARAEGQPSMTRTDRVNQDEVGRISRNEVG